MIVNIDAFNKRQNILQQEREDESILSLFRVPTPLLLWMSLKIWKRKTAKKAISS